MKPCFVDTFFFLALLNPRDARFHPQALEFNRENRPMITTAWILLELADHLCDAPNRGLFGEVRQALAADARFEIMPADQTFLDRAIELYNQRADKDWSLTDCTSFLVMRDRDIHEALMGDHHFEQSGFELLFAAERRE
jgi:uncharacterized protein